MTLYSRPLIRETEKLFANEWQKTMGKIRKKEC